MKTCKIDGCGKEQKYLKFGMCNTHYSRFYLKGDAVNNWKKQARHGERLKWLELVASQETDDCIFYPFAKLGINANGKPIRATAVYRGKSTTVSRIVCHIRHGEPQTPSLEAAHSCGNGHLNCVNPRHLSWKTPKENAEDKKMHGTYRVGDTCPASKISANMASQIKEMLAVGLSAAFISQEYEIPKYFVSNIKYGKAWKDAA